MLSALKDLKFAKDTQNEPWSVSHRLFYFFDRERILGFGEMDVFLLMCVSECDNKFELVQSF